jgi:hypothetical protein
VHSVLSQSASQIRQPAVPDISALPSLAQPDLAVPSAQAQVFQPCRSNFRLSQNLQILKIYIYGILFTINIDSLGDDEKWLKEVN